MDIQKLQALAVIQEAGSFSRAAETLVYSQAGLTYMMNSLENEIGLRLLDRSYSGVRLSETGKTLMPKIHRLLQVYDALNGEINACKCAQQATLRLAALDTVSTRWVPRAVAALKAEYPQITVSVISGSPMQVDNWLPTAVWSWALPTSASPARIWTGSGSVTILSWPFCRRTAMYRTPCP